jgi:hypothetical protein
VKADAGEPASLRSMCERAAVIITTVGPYQLHGSELVTACAATGTAYVDLCGEPAWMRRMIDAHHEEAKRTGARIVFSCGFDSTRSISACSRCRRRPGAAGQSPPAQGERRYVWRHRSERSSDVGRRRARAGFDPAAD